MKTYDYILFDWDGTIAKTLDIWNATLRQSLEKRGHIFTDKQIGANFALFRERFSEFGTATIDEIIDEATETSDKNIPMVDLYEGHQELFARLKRDGKKLAVVTTSSHVLIVKLLAKNMLMPYFDVIVGGGDVEHQKPHPESALLAMRQLSAVSEQTIMVGDSAEDILLAKNVGIDSLLFYPPKHEVYLEIEQLKGLEPTYVVENYKEMSKLLR